MEIDVMQLEKENKNLKMLKNKYLTELKEAKELNKNIKKRNADLSKRLSVATTERDNLKKELKNLKKEHNLFWK